MKQTKRIMSVVLAVVMVFMLSAPAFAAKKKNYPDYNTYMCIGDSIAAGCALSRVDGEEYDYDGNLAAVVDDPAAYAEYLTYMYSPTCDAVYRGYSPEPVPYAYHSIVANTLGAELIQGARSGMRAVELRYMLDGVYNEPDETWSWGNTYFQMNDDGVFTLDDLDLVNEQYNYVENIKRSDLISINLGSNDVNSPAFSTAFSKLSAETDDPQLAEIREFLNKTGNLGAAFEKLVDVYEAAGKLAVVVQTLNEEYTRTLKLFKENYSAIVKKIYEINPDATIVGVGTYNFFEDFRLSKDSKLDISVLASPYITETNNYIRSLQNKYMNRYYYADVIGTETYLVVYDDPHMWDLWIFKVHPNLAGHAYMAENILKALPTQTTVNLPFYNQFLSWFRSVLRIPNIFSILFGWLPGFSR